MAKNYSTSAPVKIKSTGAHKTTQGLQRRPENVKNPVNIKGRLFRDPRAMDLVDIQQANERNKRIIEETGKQIEERNKQKREKDEQARIDAAVQAKLDAQGKEPNQE